MSGLFVASAYYRLKREFSAVVESVGSGGAARMSLVKHFVMGMAVVGVCATAACSGTAHEPSPPVSTSVAASSAATATSDAVSQMKQSALAAYTGMWSDYVDAAVTADYQDQRLRQYATGPALTQLVQSLYTLKAQGFVIKGTPQMVPKVVDATPSANPTVVDIRDCASDEHWLEYVAATGKLRDAIPGGHRLVTARVEKQDNQWLVTSYAVGSEGTC